MNHLPQWPDTPNGIWNAAEQLAHVLRSHPGVVLVYDACDDTGEFIVVSVRSPAWTPIPRGIPSSFAGYRVIVCSAGRQSAG